MNRREKKKFALEKVNVEGIAVGRGDKGWPDLWHYWKDSRGNIMMRRQTNYPNEDDRQWEYEPVTDWDYCSKDWLE